MNNKGFAVSMILYSIMALLVFVMLLILGVNAASVRNKNNIAEDIKEDLSITSCKYKAGDVVSIFNYTGGVQTFVIPCNGTYKLEVWGAEGGSLTHPSGVKGVGGKGGYSQGNKYLDKGTKLYIAIGGYPGDRQIVLDTNNPDSSWFSVGKGGYNGGGFGSSYYNSYEYDDDDEQYECHNDNGAGGGGATHIALGTNRGELKNYTSYKSEVLIVAGGGGGAGGPEDGANCFGGAGGGTDGTQPVYTEYDDDDDPYYVYGAGGGTQTSGGIGKHGAGWFDGTFGAGGIVNSWYAGGGGGGGWYGGGAGGADGHGGGGGGSGYIGGVTEGATSNGQRSGNGYARITLVSLN